MFFSSAIQKYRQWLDKAEPTFNTCANHLIVIFAFSVPVLVEARRTSLALLVLLFLARGRIFFRMREALRDPVVLAFTLYFLVHVIWMVGTDDVARVGEVIHDAVFLLIPLLFSTFIDSRFVPRITSAFFAGMLISVVISFGIFFELMPAMMHDGNQGDWRDPTPFYHHTHYGYMLALTSVLLLQKIISLDDNRALKAFSFIFMVVAAANIFIIAGRSGFVLLVILLPALYLLVYRNKALKPLLAVSVVITLATVLAYNISPTFSHRIDTTKESIEKIIYDKDYYSSLGGRAAITIISFDLVSDNWALGMGTADHTGAIQEIIQEEHSNLTFLSTILAHPHNEYLNALLQFGILGLIVFLNIPYQLMRYKNENKDKEIMFKLLGVGILFYVLQDVMVIDLGMLFTTVVLVATGLRNYAVTNASYEEFSSKQGAVYVLTMAIFYLLKQI